MNRLLVTESAESAHAFEDASTTCITMAALRERLATSLAGEPPQAPPFVVRRWLARDLADSDSAPTGRSLRRAMTDLDLLARSGCTHDELAKIARATGSLELDGAVRRFARVDAGVVLAGYASLAGSGDRIALAIRRATPIELRALIGHSRITATGHLRMAPRDATAFLALESALESHAEVRRAFPVFERRLDASREADALDLLLADEEARFPTPPITYPVPGGLFVGESDARVALRTTPTSLDLASVVADEIRARSGALRDEQMAVLVLAPREVHVTIASTLEREGIALRGPDPRLSVLLAHFFNVHAELIAGASRTRVAHLLRAAGADDLTLAAARRLLASHTKTASSPEAAILAALSDGAEGSGALPARAVSLFQLSAQLRAATTRGGHLDALAGLARLLFGEAPEGTSAQGLLRLLEEATASLTGVASGVDEEAPPVLVAGELEQRAEEILRGRSGTSGVRVERDPAYLRDGTAQHLIVVGVDQESMDRARRPFARFPLAARRALGDATARYDDLELDLALAARSASRVSLLFAETSLRGTSLEPSSLAIRALATGITNERVSGRAVRRPHPTSDSILRSVARRAALERTREREHGARGEAPSFATFDRDASRVMREKTGTAAAMSVTRLEDFAKCRFRGFAAHVLRANEPIVTGDVFSAREQGSLEHALLEEVVRELVPHLKEPARDAEHLLAQAGARMDALLDEQLSPLAVGRFERERIKARLMNLVDEVVRDDAWTPERFEQEFGPRDGGWPELVLDDGEERVRLRGAIDRVDRRRDGHVRVVDYKRSKSTATKLKRAADSTALQLTVYSRAASVNLDAVAELPVYMVGDPGERVVEVKATVPLEELALTQIRRARQGDVRALPTDPDDCERCPHRVACRRPTFFFEEDERIIR